MTAIEALGLIGILLIIGFLAAYGFRKTSIPDILTLLVLGYLIGPVLNIISPSDAAPASQIISNLALATILFNGGLGLSFTQIKRSAPRTIILVTLGITAGMIATAALVHYLLELDILNSLLLGAIVGGSSPSIVIPLMNRVKAPHEVSAILSLESAFNGALVILIALIILQIIIRGSVGDPASEIGLAIAIKIGIGGLAGIVTGVLWLWILTLLKDETYDDILTLAIVFVLFFAVESIEGSGVIFAVIFGLILGNGINIAGFLHIKRPVEVNKLMKKFHAQMSFLIKTFFFVYLGLMVKFDNPAFILVGVTISLVLLLTRYGAVLLSSIGNRTLLANTDILTSMLPRGLSSAVVAEIVVISEIPDASVYPAITIIVIIATIIIAAMGIFIFARKLSWENRNSDKQTLF